MITGKQLKQGINRKYTNARITMHNYNLTLLEKHVEGQEIDFHLSVDHHSISV